ncbi:MAG TPA: M48 family metallopeptidase, partial [Candidatus Binatia bacterium]|nr:M48 family metallopeptidase [Candidatus Binatia bacterium]
RHRAGSATAYSDSISRGDARIEDRLRRTILPLLGAMDRPCQPDELRVQIMNEPTINAANAGGCQFLVTSGLLQRANDDHLLGVMAHEIAHQDLGHAVKAQMLGAGLSIGAALLEQILPGSGAIAPLAGTLIARGHSRTEEYAADRHAIVLLRRIGYPPDVMIDTLSWIQRFSGDQHAGGFLSTHPALNDRISALKKTR